MCVTEERRGGVCACVCVWQPYFQDCFTLHNNTMKLKEQQKSVNDIKWMKMGMMGKCTSNTTYSGQCIKGGRTRHEGS